MPPVWLLPLFVPVASVSSDFDISTATYLGDASDQEAVVGVAIQSNGNLIVAANAGPQTTLLKNAARIGLASANSLGCLLRFDDTGKNLLNAACVAEQLYDVALDSSDRVYVAAGQQGALSLDGTLQQVRWTTPAISSGSNVAYSHRIDVGDVVAVLASNAVGLQSPLEVDVTPGQGYIQILTLDGAISNQFRGGISADRNALDVVVHESLQLIVAVGWKQATDGPVGGPVQIPWINGYSYTGERLWVGYDWHTNRFALDGRYLNEMSVDYRNISADGNVTVVFKADRLSSNNMADGRMYRAALGEDGAIVIVGHAAGGNNLYRYDPMQVLKPANQSGFDFFTSYAGSRDQHLAWVGRFQITRTSIQVATGLPVVARLSAIRPNTLHAEGGGVASDSKGRLYLGGISAHGLPFWPNQAWKPVPGEVTMNPFSVSDYTGGAFLLAFRFNSTRSRFTQRDYCGRLVYGRTKAVAARTIGGVVRIIYGGQIDLSRGSIYTVDASQSLPGFGAADGFFVVHRYGATNTAPALAVRTGLGQGPLNLAGQQDDVPIRNSQPTRIDMDLDGNSSTIDARFIHPFSLTNPLTPVRGFAYNRYNFTYSGPPLYGGLLLDIVSVDTTRTQIPSWNRYDTLNGELIMTFADSANPGKQQTYSRGLVFAYTKDLFPEYGPNTVFSFDESSFLSFTFEQWHVKDAQDNTIMSKHLRYVVLEGDQFFVSETSLPWLGFGYQYYDHTLSFAKPIRWALWSVPDDLNFDPAAVVWGNVQFQNVRAVGYLLENDARFQIPWIQPIPNSNPPRFVSPADQPTSASDWHRINGWNIQMAFNRSVNRPPVAVVDVASRVVRVGDPLLFNATSSYDPDGYVAFVSWDFGDFTVSSGPEVNHTFPAAGLYQVVCFVWDNFRVITNYSLTIQVVRGTATNTEISRIIACWWGDPVPPKAPTNFAFYSTRSSFLTTRQELDGDGAANDALCYMPYADITRPLSGSPYRGTQIFGGFRFESANSTTSALGGWPEHTPATHNNPALTYLWNYKGIQLHALVYQSQDGVRSRLWNLWAIDKSDFLNNGDLFAVNFDAQSRLIAGPIFLAGKNGEFLRFGLRDSEQWFVSQRSWQANETYQFNLATNTGLGDSLANPPLRPSPSIVLENPGAEQWALWNPIADAMKTPTTNFAIRTFRNITAFGVVVEIPQWIATKTSPTGYFPGFGLAGLELQGVVGEQRVPPSASFTITPTSGVLPLVVTFDGSSSAPASTIVRYFWDLGDGKTYQGSRGTYNFALPGTYPVNLIVTDRFGLTSNITKFVTVTDRAGAAGAVLGFLGPKELRVAAGKSVVLFVTRQVQKIGSVSVSWNLSGKKVYSSGILAWENGQDDLKNVSIVFPSPSETVVSVSLQSPYGGATVPPQNQTVTLRLLVSASASIYPALIVVLCTLIPILA